MIKTEKIPQNLNGAESLFYRHEPEATGSAILRHVAWL